MSGKAGRGAEQFMLRLPNGMRDRIKAAAEFNGRSMNAEIIDALSERFPPIDPNKLLYLWFNQLPLEEKERYADQLLEQLGDLSEFEEGTEFARIGDFSIRKK